MTGGTVLQHILCETSIRSVDEFGLNSECNFEML